MTRLSQYFIGVSCLAPFWLIVSFSLMMDLVGAEDSGLPIGEIATYKDGHEIVSLDPNYKGDHQGEFPPVPLWLKVACGISCPIFYLLPENGFPGLSDHANGTLALAVMAANSILWAFALVFLLRLMVRFFARFSALKPTIVAPSISPTGR